MFYDAAPTLRTCRRASANELNVSKRLFVVGTRPCRRISPFRIFYTRFRNSIARAFARFSGGVHVPRAFRSPFDARAIISTRRVVRRSSPLNRTGRDHVVCDCGDHKRRDRNNIHAVTERVRKRPCPRLVDQGP